MYVSLFYLPDKTKILLILIFLLSSPSGTSGARSSQAYQVKSSGPGQVGWAKPD